MADEPIGGGNSPATGDQPKPYEEWRKDIPDEYVGKLREEITPEVVNWFEKNLRDTYGDEFIQTIADLREDEEARNFIAKDFRDKERRQFYTGPARKAYDSAFAQNPPSVDGQVPARLADDATAKRVEGLEKTVKEFVTAQQQQAYQAQRTREWEAIRNEFPELNFQKADLSDPAYRAAVFMIETAEKFSTPEKPFPYRNVWAEMQGVKNLSLPSAPATTLETEPRIPQAPRNEMDRRESTVQMLKKAGGAVGLARTIKGARR